MKFYTLKEKSTANFSPNYRSCLTGTCTNGNIVVAGYKYSDDGGATWKDANETTVGDAIYISGNDVWKVFQIPPADEPDFKVYKSTDGGVTYTQVGPTYSYPNANYENFAVAWVISCPAGDFFAITMTLKATGYTFIAMQQLVSVEEWRQMSYDALPGVEGAYGYIPIRTAYFHDASIFFLVQNDMPTNRANSYALIASILPSMTLTYPHYAFNNVGGTNNLWIDFEMDNSAYISKDAFVKLDTETYMVCGALYTDAGVLVEPCLLKNDDVDIVSGWTEVAKERIIPINGTSFRVWGFILDSNKIYLSHNNGKNFFAVTYNAYSSVDALVNSTWEGGIEITDSDWGFGGFDGGKFYTFEETIWGDWFVQESLDFGIRNDEASFSAVTDRTHFNVIPSGFVICIRNTNGDPLFTGRFSGASQDGDQIKINFAGLTEELENIRPTDIFVSKTITNIIYSLINDYCSYCYTTTSSLSSESTTYNIEYKGDQSLASIFNTLDRFQNYQWWYTGDLRLVLDDMTTTSGISCIKGTTDTSIPRIDNEGRRIANRIIIKGRVEINGPVLYQADDVDSQTLNGIIPVKEFHPEWDYDRCKAYADQILLDRKEWSDIITLDVNYDDTIQPGTTIYVEGWDSIGITTGTYVIQHIHHEAGISTLTLNNTSISVGDWGKQEAEARTSLEGEWQSSTQDNTSVGSAQIPAETLDDLKSRILRHAISEAQAWTFVYDATHSAKLWVDSEGALHVLGITFVGDADTVDGFHAAYFLNAANIEDAIVDAHTTIAPSGNAVFDALALKQDHLTAVQTDGSHPITGYLDVTEIAIPATPAPNNLRLFVEDFKGFSFFSFKDDTGMVRKIVRDSVFVAKNVTGVAIPLGNAVYASGSSGNVPTIALAKANAVGTMPAIGVTIEAIADGNFGRVMQVGLLENFDTNAFTEGNVLYVDPAVAGGLTATLPSYPNFAQEIGTVLVKSVGAGAIQIISRSMLYPTLVDAITDSDLTHAPTGNAVFDALALKQVHTTAIQTDGSHDFTGHQKLKDSSPTDDLHAASKGYVDTKVGLVEDAIVDGHTTIAPSGNAVFDALALKLALAGGTMSGPIAMGAQVISGGARFDFTLPMCLLEKDAAQAITSSYWTAIAFAAGDEISDLLGWHNPDSNNTRITPTKAGYYLVIGQITWGATTGELGGHLLFDGTTPAGYRGRSWTAAPTSQGQSTCIDVVYFDGVNDYVELLAYHSSGGYVNATSNRLWCIRLSTGGAAA